MAATTLAVLLLGAPAARAMPFRDVEIRVLSNRADLVSGGDALVEIVLPANADPAAARVTVNGVDRTAAFAVRGDGRFLGLLTGLAEGKSEVAAWVAPSARSSRASPRPAARLTITNHSPGGPVFSGAQLEPWICAQPVPAPVEVSVPGTSLTASVTPRASGLDGAPDAACNAPAKRTYWYISRAKADATPPCAFTNTVNGCFARYCLPGEPDCTPATPDSDVASFTNDRGDTVRAIVVLERGTIDRGIYQLVTFFDPTLPSVPWDPQRGWNQKLLWKFGPQQLASSANSRFQTPPVATLVWDDAALRRGYMVASSSLTDHGTNTNDTLGAEAMMMLKEHIVETYGEIRFTLGAGCSDIFQHNIAAAYPGLLDGIQPNCTFADTLTTAIEVQDCGLLQDRYYRTGPDKGNGSALSAAQRAAVNGHAGTGFCQTWINSLLPGGNPGRSANCGAGSPATAFPAALTYDALLRPDGVRCTPVDHDASMLGTWVDDAGIRRASSPLDNEGVQYGLGALAAGLISAEEFVRLNEWVGSYSADQVWTGDLTGVAPAPRGAASAETLRTVYTSGIVSGGGTLGKVAIIDLRGNEPAAGDIHMNWRAWSVRARLDQAIGDHDNQVIWAFNGSLTPGAALATRSFLTLDEWLTNVERDVTDHPVERKIRDARPAAAHDLCLPTNGATDASLDEEMPLDDPGCPVKPRASPRQVAGGPLAEDVFKCQLRPLDLASPDYGGAVFTPEQHARLAAVFPEGVCDWSRPGVEQQPSEGWTTFVDGPGGRPLGPPPAAVQDCPGSSAGRGSADGAGCPDGSAGPGR